MLHLILRIRAIRHSPVVSCCTRIVIYVKRVYSHRIILILNFCVKRLFLNSQHVFIHLRILLSKKKNENVIINYCMIHINDFENSINILGLFSLVCSFINISLSIFIWKCSVTSKFCIGSSKINHAHHIHANKSIEKSD